MGRVRASLIAAVFISITVSMVILPAFVSKVDAASSGWLWSNPRPQGNDLHATWGMGPNFVLGVGNCGAIVQFNDLGAAEQMASPTTKNLYGVWAATSPAVGFAVGQGGTILRFNGSTWSQMSSPTTKDLNAVWGSSGTDVFAVGSDGTVVNYNGSTWSTMPSGTTQDLNGVWGSSGSNVFAVGRNGTIIRYNGSTWSTMSSPTVDHIVDISGISANEAYAVDKLGKGLQYNGTTWSLMPACPDAAFFGAVWANASNDIYAVGQNGATSFPTIFHYNGTSWSQTSPPSLHKYYFLWDIWGVGSELFAVGDYGVILYYEGIAWTAITGDCINDISSIWGYTLGDLTAVGEHGRIYRYWESGSFWYNVSSTATTQDLLGVWGTSGSNIFAAGRNGSIVHYNGTSWSAMNSGTVLTFSSVSGSSGSDVFAVGENGNIRHYNGNRLGIWDVMVSGTTKDLLGVHTISYNNVYAVGEDGIILHYTGGSWIEYYDPRLPQEDLEAVWGTDADNVFAVGNSGTILHYDGASWATMSSPTMTSLTAVWGFDGRNVFATGDGVILFFNGYQWKKMTAPIAAFSALEAAWVSFDYDVFVAGDSGKVLYYRGPVGPAHIPAIDILLLD